MPEREEEPARTAAEVAAAQTRVAGRLLGVLLDPVQGDTYVRGVLPAPDGSPVRHRTLPLLRALAEPSPAGVPEVRLRKFWLTEKVAVDLAREADPVVVRRAVSGSNRYTALLGDPHCTAHLRLADACPSPATEEGTTW
ncbi:hypothetical protein [Streptomyces albidoflavus]|uniref:hypothetical protein n=1 Tax=Streptomyces albidoflavus TaxID=1886 RepID=UPI0033B780F5